MHHATPYQFGGVSAHLHRAVRPSMTSTARSAAMRFPKPGGYDFNYDPYATATPGIALPASGWSHSNNSRALYAQHYNQLNFGMKNDTIKTRICTNWLEGQCQYGDKCTFAHGEHELRNNEKSENTQKKTRLCKNWQDTGNCRYQDKCHFAHGSEEIGQNIYGPKEEKGSANNTETPSQPAAQTNIVHEKVKTKLCRTYTETGDCRYGNQCLFIHDDDVQQMGQVLAGMLPVSALNGTKFEFTDVDQGIDSGPTSKRMKSDSMKIDEFLKDMSKMLRDLTDEEAEKTMNAIRESIKAKNNN